MYINEYVLEVMTRTRLADLRADSARHVLLASLRAPRPSAWAVLKSALRGAGCGTGGRKIVSPRHA
jgi:hypothetical protein